jgi:hypothetical protein
MNELRLGVRMLGMIQLPAPYSTPFCFAGAFYILLMDIQAPFHYLLTLVLAFAYIKVAPDSLIDLVIFLGSSLGSRSP